MKMPTLIPGSEHKEDSLNPVHDNYERTFRDSLSQDDVERGIHNLESMANNPKEHGKSEDKTVEERESEGDDLIRSSYTGEGNKKGASKKIWLRRGGIIGGTGGIIGVLLMIFTGLFGGAGVLLNLGESTTANLDHQSSFLTRRMYAVLDTKIGGDMTKGSCDIVKIACRFTRPSNSLLDRLEKNGIKAVNASGEDITKTKGPWPNEKPTHYAFTDKAGTTHMVNAKDFTKTLRDNPEFRNMFTKAYNARYWGYADSFIRKAFKKIIGSDDRTGDKAKKIDPDKPQESITKIVADADSNNSVKKASGPEAKNAAASEMLSKELTGEVEKAAKKGLKTGDPVLAVGTAACLGINAPGIITKIVRLYQIRQEVTLAMTLVLTTYGMLKSGDMDPKTMATIGTLLTSTALLPDGKQSKSFMDAAAIKNILFGDNIRDASFMKFVPGYNAIQSTKGISTFANNQTTKDACNMIYSPVAAVASTMISAAIGSATLGVGAAVLEALKAGGKLAAQFGAVDAIMNVLSDLGVISGLISTIIGLVPPEQIAELLGNQDIDTANREDLGNATGIGIKYVHQLAFENTGGAPGTVSQMASYNESQKEYMIAYAEQDRVDRSPFDISSPYTFLGSIVSGYTLATYGQGNISQKILSSVGYALSQPLKLFTNTSYADESKLAAQYSYASDFGVDSKYAIDASGSAYTLIPTEFQGESTASVLSSVSGEIDDSTGDAKEGSAIENRLATCTSADLLAVSGCAINNQDEANISLYITDKRLNDTFDGVNPDQGEGEGGSATGAAAGATFNEADLFIDSTNIACAPGTTDAGTDTAYHGGPSNSFQIRLCAIPNTSQAGDPMRVNSVVSGAVNAMITAMRADLGESVIKISDSYRTKEGQEHAWRCYAGGRLPGEDCSDIAGRAASPGNSIHQSGNAIDFQLPSGNSGSSRPGDRYWDWLTANAGKYGYKQLADESWHWSATGG